jgi:hypothetical protein
MTPLPAIITHLTPEPQNKPPKTQDRRPDKSRLRVVQYNVEFFFLDHSTGGVPCPGACVHGLVRVWVDGIGYGQGAESGWIDRV